MAALLEAEAVRCVFIQDNPAYDGLRASLGLRAAAGAAPPLPPRGALSVAEPGMQVWSSLEMLPPTALVRGAALPAALA